jgi:hypothetical protein
MYFVLRTSIHCWIIENISLNRYVKHELYAHVRDKIKLGGKLVIQNVTSSAKCNRNMFNIYFRSYTTRTGLDHTCLLSLSDL